MLESKNELMSADVIKIIGEQLPDDLMLVDLLVNYMKQNISKI